MSRRPRLFMAAIALCVATMRATEPLEIPVWSSVPPGSEGQNQGEVSENRGKDGIVDRALRQIHRPTITVYLPEKGLATGVAILLAPGGGYEHLAVYQESHHAPRWMATLRI